MRIAIDGRTIGDHFPGIGRYTFNLVRALATIAPEEEWLLLYDPREAATRLSTDALSGLPGVRRAQVSARVFSLAGQWRIPAALRREGARLYHSPYYIMPYGPGCPTVVTLYDLIPMRYPDYFTPVQRVLFGITLRLAVRTAQRVIVLSEATASDLARWVGVPRAKVAVIPAAADPDLAAPAPEESAAVRARLGLPAEYVLYLGSNKPHKNLPRLVDAWTRVQTDLPLVVAGHWDSRYPEAKRAASTRGADRVRWLGPVAEPDLAALYGAASLFVFPSEYEGFGLPVLEAMRCGTPVACARTSSLVEVAGEAAMLFDPLQVESMAETLSQALRAPSLRAELRAKGLAQAERFSWEKAARATLDVYRQAAG